LVDLTKLLINDSKHTLFYFEFSQSQKGYTEDQKITQKEIEAGNDAQQRYIK